MIYEDGPSAFDHPAHTAVDGSDLHHALNHLNRAAMLVDNDGESRPFDNGGQHWRIDCKVRNPGVLDLEEQGAEILDDAREAGRLRSRWKPKLTLRSNDDVIRAPDQGRSSGRTRQQDIAGGELAIHLYGGRLQAGVHDSRIAAQLSDQPFVAAGLGSGRGRAEQEK
jgi:hypothetical protein